MYIFLFDFSKNTIKTYLKLDIRVVCREVLVFKYVFIVFFETNQMIIKNVSSSTSLKKTSVFTSFRLYENLRKFILTHSFMNRF